MGRLTVARSRARVRRITIHFSPKGFSRPAVGIRSWETADAGAAPTPVGWNMLGTSVRRRVIAAIGTSAFAVIASLAVVVPPAHAAPSGYWLTKGTGSIYSKVGIVNLGVVPGGTAKTFYYKIVNTAPTAESFKVNLTKFSPQLTAKLYKGTTAVPDEYVTPAVAAGKTLALKVKVTLPAGTPQGEYV